VKQTTLSQNGSSLLDYAISKLNPEVFSHPVWIRFGKPERLDSLDFIVDLLSAAQELEKNDPSATCQILLICAVYQNKAGQHYNALRNTQKARALAENASLAREILWVLWATCSISIQGAKYEQAANCFADLQAVLTEQNEWILADFVDVVRQSLVQPIAVGAGKNSRSTCDPPSTDLLAFTFEWLQEWGFSAHPAQSEFGGISSHPASHVTTHSTFVQSFFSMQRWQGRWHTLMLAIRGELRLHWARNDLSRTHKRVSIWGSILSSLRFYMSRGSTGRPAIQDIPQIRSTPLLPPAKESSPFKGKARRNKPIGTGTKVNKKSRTTQVAATVPVAVHMLGTFSMTIGDLTLKLPSSRGLSVLKYLLLYHQKKIPRDMLIDTFWPDADPETARNNLNVALHSLRKALRAAVFLPVIAFESGTYGLESNLQIWLDVEEFERCIREGQRLEYRNQLTAAVAEYETAVSLYQGDFLEQNPYEEWTVLEREHLRIAYLDTLDRLSQIYFSQERYAACITACQLILRRDRCREDAHCLLMCCYSRQGQYHLALRQYQTCVEALHAELNVEPAPETMQLYEKVRQRKVI
jgi:DNA-binding SARP family transcriptional activator